MPIFDSAPITPTSPAITGPVIATGILLVAVAVLPGLAFFFGASSLATGMAIAAAAIIADDLAGLLGATSSNKAGVAGLLIILAIVIGLHLFVGMALTGQGDIGRVALSLIILFLMVTASWVLAARIPMLDDRAIDAIMFGLLGLFVLAALLSIAGLQPPSPRGILAKSVFPFSEPSHYAFSASSLILFACMRLTFIWRGLVIVVFLAIAYALQSLSLVVVVLLAAIVTLPIAWLALAMVVVVPLLTLFDTQYFSDRLDFSAHSTNISSLIYIQGLELAESSVRATAGWGIGFQQLGVGEIHSLTANAIAAILREDSNIFDGGFTGAKLVAEFGLFGLAAVMTYLVMVIARVPGIRRALTGTSLPSAETLFAATLLGFLVELFVRGAGYFTGTSMLMLASVFYFARRSRAASSQADASSWQRMPVRTYRS